ncbi:MAG: hypothetical protein J7K71_04970 [Candidatus Omnitrophica bacterium]|nr:hypothetical protein [Candidatus Omnitrophota bacterium]
MGRIGLYLAPNSIYVSTLKKGAPPSFKSYPLEGKDIFKEATFEILINKIARELNINKDDEIYLALEDRYFFFRSFVVPSMGRKGIESSITFEIDKYIPFKIEELTWNYGYKKIPQKKKGIVSFIGIKRTLFGGLSQPFSKLELTLSAIEPSCLALLRLIANRCPIRKKWFAVLDLSSHACYLTLFFENLPLFNRTIFSFRGEIVYGDNVVAPGEPAFIDKLTEEIRFSLHYFEREYRPYSVEKLMVIVDNSNKDKLLSSLREKLSIEVEFYSPQEILNMPVGDVNTLKAYSALTFSQLSKGFLPLLEDSSTCFLGGAKAFSYPINLFLLGVLIILGVLFSLILNTSLKRKIEFLERKVSQVESVFPLEERLKSESPQTLRKVLKEKEAKINAIKEKINAFVDVGPVLERLGFFLPRGVWLEEVNLIHSKGGSLEAKISGYIWLGSPAKEINALDKLILNIREDEVLKRFLPHLDLVGKEAKVLRGVRVTHFRIRLY